MRRSPKRVSLALAATVAASLAVAAPALTASGKATTVNVTLSEMKVTPSIARAPAGTVTFRVRNAGTMVHELVVVRSDAAPGKLPVKNGRASEKGRAGEASDLAPGASKTLTLTLKPGKYVLLCNVVGHYQAGMYRGFTVE